MTTLVALGAGNMGQAILAGLRRAEPSASLAAADPSAAARARAAALGARVFETPERALENAGTGAIVLLAVKPQQWAALAPALAAAPKGVVFISILAGVKCAAIEAAVGAGAAVVRAMPNTPALLGAGMTAIAPGRAAGEKNLAAVEALFAAVGRVVRVREEDLDAVTAISGSGPAYFFLLAEALEAAAREMGLEAATARALAAQTAFGAGRMLAETGEEAAVLRARVTSPGGTTQAAIEEFARRGFSEVARAGAEAALRRAREMGG